MARQFFEKLDVTLARRGEPNGAAASAVAAVAAVSPLARAEGWLRIADAGC